MLNKADWADIWRQLETVDGTTELILVENEHLDLVPLKERYQKSP